MKPNFKSILSNSLRITMDIAAEAVGNNPEYFKKVLNISLEEKPSVNWRASRVIALCIDKHPNLFIPYVNKIAQLFPNFNNDGLKRSYAYVLSKYVKYLNEDSQADLIDVCFDYMLSDEKIAVKYNCMKLLFELTKIIPELKGELAASIDYNIQQDVFRMNGEIKRVYKAINN